MNTLMIMLHILAVIFFIPALIITIPAHLYLKRKDREIAALEQMNKKDETEVK